MNQTNLSEDHIDALGEIMNISYGLATSIISDSIETQATLHVPKIEVLDVDELPEFINSKTDPGSRYYVSIQVFLNRMDGESIFMIDETSSKNVASIFMNFDDIEIENEDDVRSCIHELSNILTSACIGKLAELLELDVFFHPPKVEIKKGAKVAEYKTDKFSKVIVVETVMDFEEEKVKGLLIFLMKEGSFQCLTEALDNFIENYEV
ncbi:hypothetical protein [Limisalsivibrio acetivorans]|uniref:hypothetical protein n=1 Tax=Limisalsivibrio acetivorans TaxID=1304888 RepID=UPI0003B37674|nr:hypothetical protein [Limisalsivibrio acetivorans]